MPREPVEAEVDVDLERDVRRREKVVRSNYDDPIRDATILNQVLSDVIGNPELATTLMARSTNWSSPAFFAGP